MKRSGAMLIVACAMAALSPYVATSYSAHATPPAATELVGNLAHGGRIHLSVSKVEREQAPFIRFEFEVRRISLVCAGGRVITQDLEGWIVTPAKPRPGFASRAIYETESGRRFSIKISGRLRSKVSAAGLVRAKASGVPVGDGVRARCRSGPLKWIAHAKG